MFLNFNSGWAGENKLLMKISRFTVATIVFHKYDSTALSPLQAYGVVVIEQMRLKLLPVSGVYQLSIHVHK